MKPTVIIWDLGNVFVPWNPRRLYSSLFPDSDAGRRDMEHFLATVVPPYPFNHRLDLGESAAVLCEEAIRQHPHVDPALIRAYADRWPDMLGPLIDTTVELFRATKERGVRGFALSNWGTHFVDAMELYPVFHEFDGRLVSYEIGVGKPDPIMFETLLERFDLRADDCLFVDDSNANILAAQSLGFHTHHFSDPEALRRDLIDFGLLDGSGSQRPQDQPR